MTVAGFSVVPLLIGLTAVAVLAPLGGWVVRIAYFAGPALAVGTIVVMTLPADFDTTSTVTLAVCHLTLVPIIIVVVAAIARRVRRTRGAAACGQLAGRVLPMRRRLPSGSVSWISRPHGAFSTVASNSAAAASRSSMCR